MKKINLLTSLIALVTLVGCNGGNSSPATSSSNNEKPCTVSEDNKVHLILLAGQSGGRGKAVNSDLSEEEKAPNDDVDIMADG